MRMFSIVTVSAINVFIGFRYWWLLRQQRIRPALAMWILFSVATTVSLLAYLAEGAYSPLENILNTTDIAMVSSVAIAILIYGDRSTRLTRFDRGCLGAVMIIITFWGLTRQHVAAHLLIQLVLVIAYLPVLRRLHRATENTESFAIWFAMFLAPVVSLLSSRGTLATVYAVRNIACTALLLLVMGRISWRAYRRRIASEAISGLRILPWRRATCPCPPHACLGRQDKENHRCLRWRSNEKGTGSGER